MREFSIDSRDMKTKLACYIWEPASEAKAILVLAHGMQEYLLRYSEMAEYMASQGIIFAGLDHLGHGRSAASRDDLGYFCEQDPATVLVRDLHRLKKTVQAEHPGLPVIVMGHSMGSFIVRSYIERYGTGIQGAIIQGSNAFSKAQGITEKAITRFLAAFFGWRHRSGLCTALVLGPYARAFPNDNTAWLTRRKEVREKYNNDELSRYIFTLNGYHTMGELILRAGDKKKMAGIPKDLPMLIISGDMDPVGEMGKGVQRMYDQYKAMGFSNLKLDIRPDDRHELHNEEDRYQVFEEIRDFILEQKL